MRLLVCAIAFCGLMPAQGRVRPPAALTCGRDYLTSYAGDVVEYTRTPSRITLRVKTDADTDERFTVRLTKAKPAAHWMLVDSEKFAAGDWKKVESAAGKLRPGVTVIVWKCEGAANPVLDWRLPPE